MPPAMSSMFMFIRVRSHYSSRLIDDASSFRLYSDLRRVLLRRSVPCAGVRVLSAFNPTGKEVIEMGKNGWLLKPVLAAHKRPPSLLTQRFTQRYIEAMGRHEPEPDPKRDKSSFAAYSVRVTSSLPSTPAILTGRAGAHGLRCWITDYARSVSSMVPTPWSG
jgi:hypothetical protein